MEFFIIGCGTGSGLLLTQEAKKAVSECDRVFSTVRIASAFEKTGNYIEEIKYSELTERASQARGKKIGILVSGDSGFFSAAKKLKAELQTFGKVNQICGISSMQYFFSKIAMSYEDCIFESLHGRKADITGLVSYNKKVFLLTGGKECNCADILKQLNDAEMDFLEIYIGEELSSDNEKITKGTVKELINKNYSELSVMLILNPNYTDKALPFYDKDFIRGDIPMTKEEIRWISVNRLNIKPDFVCWDIGSGTGSVSLEMAKKADRGRVYAVDKKPEAVSLLKKNIKKLGCFNITSVQGEAVDKIKDFPSPDAVFIGGSGGHIKEIIEYAYEKNKETRIVVNSIALETAVKTIQVFKELEIKDTQVINVNISKGKSAGELTMLLAGNPITIISGGGRNDT